MVKKMTKYVYSTKFSVAAMLRIFVSIFIFSFINCEKLLGKQMSRRFSVAPMMGHTDRHFRYFWRLLSDSTILFTEMVVADALISAESSKLDRILGFHERESPLILQLGGRNPSYLAQAALMSKRYGFYGVNLNCGCPSGTVAVESAMGAALMADPLHTAECCASIIDVLGSDVEMSVKCRVGIDELDSFDDLCKFIQVVSEKGGVSRFQVHARKALLGIGAIRNRDVPPLDWQKVYDLANTFPNLNIELNGGITSVDEAVHHLNAIPALAGVMIGRACVNHPFSFVSVDNDFFPRSKETANEIESPGIKTRGEILYKYLEYCAGLGKLANPVAVSSAIAPTFNLFTGEEGCELYRRRAKQMVDRGVLSPAVIVETALQAIPPAVLGSSSWRSIEDITASLDWMNRAPKTSRPLRAYVS